MNLRGVGGLGRTAPVRVVWAAIVALLVVVALPSEAVAEERHQVPRSMAGLGDSITRGFNACGFYYDCTSRSWSTGSGNAVHSHYERLRVLHPRMKSAANVARRGAKVAALPSQAQAAVDREVGYATVLIGANDACTATEDAMTPVADFQVAVTDAFAVFASSAKPPLVYVASIPDIYRLWEVGKDSSAARTAWSTLRICQSMLANPTSTADADVERRARVQQRVIEYNAVLASVCDAHTFCRHDGGAVFDYRFELSHLSRWDYFHPNTSGQNVLAEVTWATGFAWDGRGNR